LYVTLATGMVSEIEMFVAVAPPAALLTAMQYSTTAPGIILGFEELIGSLMILLVFVTVS